MLQTYQRAHSHRIIGSAVYDALVLMGLLMIAGFIAVGLHYWITDEETIQPNSLPFQLYLLTLVIGYFLYFWRKSGQTVGMKAWRIKLISLEDAPITLKQALLRLLVAMPSFACFLVGVLWQYIDKDQLNWQDRASQTKLVYLPKTKLK